MSPVCPAVSPPLLQVYKWSQEVILTTDDRENTEEIKVDTIAGTETIISLADKQGLTCKCRYR